MMLELFRAAAVAAVVFCAVAPVPAAAQPIPVFSPAAYGGRLPPASPRVLRQRVVSVDAVRLRAAASRSSAEPERAAPVLRLNFFTDVAVEMPMNDVGGDADDFSWSAWDDDGGSLLVQSAGGGLSFLFTRGDLTYEAVRLGPLSSRYFLVREIAAR